MLAEVRSCQNCKASFTVESEDFEFYKKISVSAPTWCPTCRNQRRMSWRNERSLFKRQCNAPGHTESLISMYDPAGPYKVYDAKYWWSDQWDALSYGREFDFKKPFFGQFAQLMKDIPLIALSNINSVNSEYTNFVAENKNCYLVFGAGLNENVRYANQALESRDSQDLLMTTRGELCYECVNCQDLYRVAYSEMSKNCTDSYFLYNCRDCNSCFGCTNLVSKSYCIFNDQYTKEDYQQKLKEFKLSSYASVQELWKKFEALKLQAIHKYSNIIGSVNCTGDNIANSKNCTHCFDIFENVEDSKYLYSALRLKDCYDGNGIYQTQYSAEMVDSNDSSGSLGTVTTYNSTDAKYSFNCHSCTNIFGCVNLRNKNYCILNKQYSKEEYQKLLPQIIKQMREVPYVDKKGRTYDFGDFYPSEISPWAYNETIAYQYYPLTKEQASAAGFNWKSVEEKHHSITKKASELPDDISGVPESIANEVIGCAHEGNCEHLCAVAFKLIPQEIDFYKKLQIPLPKLCHNCRHFERLKRRRPYHIYPDHCQCSAANHSHADKPCPASFETPFAPGHKEKLYCEKCYHAEVS